MPNCPECHAEVFIGEAFCAQCGRSLADVVGPAPAGPTPAPGGPAEGVPQPSPEDSASPPPPVSPQAPALEPPAAQESELQREPTMEGRVCPACGRGNPVDSNFCGQCGARLTEEATVALGGSPGRPSVIVQPAGPELPFGDKDRVIIGRADPSTGWRPDIDLSPHGGTAEAGVSRRHCVIVRRAEGWLIQDMGAVNPSRILTRNRQLAANEAAPLVNGDAFTVGCLTLVFRSS